MICLIDLFKYHLVFFVQNVYKYITIQPLVFYADWKILNTAPSIFKKIPKFFHITDILKDLHWLLIKQRIAFKILLLTYQAYHNTAPNYLCELITLYYSARNLRSNDMMLV